VARRGAIIKDYEPGLSFSDAASASFHDLRGDEAEAVDFLHERARGGPVLELAIGTGRIALPLASRGVRVDGIDISATMLERLREKPGGAALTVKLGDFVDVDVQGDYCLVYIVWNSFFNVLTQADQIRCIENVADHLGEDGVFVLEAYVPGYLHRLDGGQQVAAQSVEIDAVKIDVLTHDAATQTIEESHVTLSTDGVCMTPVVQRYAWPSELDLMAKHAGLELKERFGGWHREPFDSGSDMHVSVYAR
jgi:SAM-dependent methyltransferase